MPELVADINRGAEFDQISQIVALGDVALFVAEDGVHGTELWRSDGTSAGTALVVDLRPGGGSSPMLMAEINGQWLFTADDGEHGRELWRTDGTAAGTELIFESAPGEDSLFDDAFAGQFTASDTLLYFTVGDGTVETQLWKTDGSLGGAALVATFQHDFPEFPLAAAGLADLTMVGERLFFTYDDGPHGSEIWTNDGGSGARMVTDLLPPNDSLHNHRPGPFVVSGDHLYFVADDGVNGRQLWRTDGFADDARRITNFAPEASDGAFRIMAAAFHGVYFDVFDARQSGDTGVWFVHDESRTVSLVKAFNRDEFGSEGFPSDTWFAASDSSGITFVSLFGPFWYDNYEIVLWENFRVLERLGTRKSLSQGGVGNGPSDPAVTQFTKTSNALFFTVDNNESGREIWVRDEGVHLVKDIVPGAEGSLPQLLTAVGDKLFFQATDAQGVRGLWVSDGTADGTHAVEVPNLLGTNSRPTEITKAGAYIYFGADDGLHGRELWRTDGTTAGTQLVVDVNAGAQGSFGAYYRGGGGDVTTFQDKLYFLATPISDVWNRLPELWQTTGPADHTFSLAAQFPQYVNVANGNALHATDDALFVVTFARDHWPSSALYGISSADSPPAFLGNIGYYDSRTIFGQPLIASAVDGVVFFDDLESEDPSTVRLIFSDGTPEGTKTLVQFDNADNFSDVITIGNSVYFTEERYGIVKLYRFDMLSQELKVLADLPRLYLREPYEFQLADLNGTLMFAFSTFHDGQEGYELWTSDGSVGGTRLVKDFRTGSFSQYPDSFTVVGDSLYFTVFGEALGDELWRTDGTPEGTRLVADIAADGASSFPLELTAVGDALYFTAQDLDHGRELWRTDGTAAGTVMIADLYPGGGPLGSSYPHDLAYIDGALYFGARDPAHGDEMWRLAPRDGDTDLDGDVDLSDLNNVRNHFGDVGLGDANGDGDVDLDDLNIVRNLFGSDAAPSATLAVKPRALTAHASAIASTEHDLRAVDLVYGQLLAANNESAYPFGKRKR